MLKAMFNEGEKGKARMEGGAHENEVASSKFYTRKGGHTVSKQGLLNYGQDIVMAFSPPVVVCLVKKGFQEGGHGHPRTPCYALDEYTIIHTLFMTKMAKIDTLFMTKTAKKPYPLEPHIPI